MSIFSRLSHAWKAFTGNRDPTFSQVPLFGYGSGGYNDRVLLSRGNERSIINAIFTRIAIDVSSVNIQHIRVDENGRYVETMDTYLNECLTVEANKDQTARHFFRDVVLTMFDEGVVAIVPTQATDNIINSNAFDVKAMRAARIIEWYPDHVRVRIYNDEIGEKVELTFPKRSIAIIENPLYCVMNEPNSTLRRLISKLNLLDNIDNRTGSDKLDMIVQFPYSVKNEWQREKADERRKDLEDQLSSSQYGIAWIDATEKITQLNRPIENNMMKQVEYLTQMLYNQLGMTLEVFNGTADEAAMLNYNNRTIEPILSAITDEMKRKFLTKTARSKGQTIMFFRDPFKLVPVAQMADIVDKFTRNEVLSSNEVRAIMGYKPSDDPRADELRNKNLNDPNAGQPLEEITEMPIEEEFY